MATPTEHRLQAQRLEELRARNAPRLAASREAFQRRLLEAEADRAAAAPTAEVLSVSDFVTKLASMGGPLRRSDKDDGHGTEADQAG